MKTILIWLKTLLSSSDEISSKRVVTIVCLLLISGLIISHIFGVKIDSQNLWPLVSLCAASIGFTVAKDIFKSI